MLLAFICFVSACEEAVPDTRASFTITINNLSSGDQATLLSDGVFYTHKYGHPLFFNLAQDYGQGLESLAEDGVVEPLHTNLGNRKDVISVGFFGPIPTGNSITFTLQASYGEFLNFASMFTDANDLFYSFDDEGVSLFNPDGTPFNGDITAKVWLWDAGTEENQEPYAGSFQPARQSQPNEGPSTLEPIRLVADGFSYPPKKQIIQVLISGQSL